MGEKLVVIIGPTAVGKTKMSIELAKRLNGEIISGDSMQIYKGMDIGTAKIKPEEMEGIPHHLLDIKEPDESFSVAEFQQLVRPLIREITRRGNLPMIVGGTGLYIQSVIYDYRFSDAPSNETYRRHLECIAEEKGGMTLHERLKKIDPQSAERIHPHNVRRVIRALEVYHCTGKTMTEWQKTQTPELLYDVALVGLTMEREQLYRRIDERVDQMIAEGLLQEVKSLYEQGIRDCQSIQAIGYKEFYAYLDGHMSWEEAVEQLKRNSRRYAKRQLTWFRNKMPVQWFDMTDLSAFAEKTEEILRYIAGKLRLEANI
ncbi:tRNA (adenosine(37)-N6)-dimethylallyltransferase MiaA [Thermaerobacillus caldiproteolyticus]|uniref:tRNA dimethylallyltransferase n=1 Tax=Thermaerobacillus caldiproteolyticus TaxID=247480 RepID=A0A7V9Z9M0_9BACL|nr:tRNA (adenosine(37)-N6)-dimethylallyltransferase MiaA [Anoxybacillus caldiproteolyticus]MBA2876604.1 tRNA dimethylallyltransferase [Anoxybacillus caldiproteolyticus]QPA32150.1 tRNA (adenosine(37)-N6)-dimethylallyltransferase MiaA [Anoxybacillus caldiproteolyticus]